MRPEEEAKQGQKLSGPSAAAEAGAVSAEASPQGPNWASHISFYQDYLTIIELAEDSAPGDAAPGMKSAS